LGNDFDIRVIPEPPSIFDLFAPPQDDEFAAGARTAGRSSALAKGGLRGVEAIQLISGPNPADASILSHPAVATALAAISTIDPVRVQVVLRALQRLDLLQREQAITMMPFEITIR
jgi:hypothetical protein